MRQGVRPSKQQLAYSMLGQSWVLVSSFPHFRAKRQRAKSKETMTYWFRFFGGRKLKPTEVQAKVPMITGPRSKRKFELVPVRDPEIYPLLICVSAGFTMLAIYSVHNFMLNPDINVKKTRRETPTIERYDPKEAEKFTKYHDYLATLRPNPANTDKSFDLFDAYHYDKKLTGHSEDKKDESRKGE